ncbi:hypothetical protein ACTXT7_000165 [Hymenolepis weldensis]
MPNQGTAACATGENWQEVMLDCDAGRECEGSGTSCGSKTTYLYFVTFIFFSTFLMLNLFVAVIMDNFDYLTRDSSILGPHHLDEYVRVWAEYDPTARGRIHHSDMYEMLRNMEPPVGFGKKCPYRLAYRKLIRMNMPVDDNGTVHFTTTLFALIRESLGIKMGPAEIMDQRDNELRYSLHKLWPVQTKRMINILVPPDSELVYQKMTVGKIYAGMLILENYRMSKQPHEKDQSKSADLVARFFGAVTHNVHRSARNSETEDDSVHTGRWKSPTKVITKRVPKTKIPASNTNNSIVQSKSPNRQASHLVTTTTAAAATQRDSAVPMAPTEDHELAALSRSSDLSSIEEEEEIPTNVAEPLEPVRSIPSGRLASRPIATYPTGTEFWQREPPRPARFQQQAGPPPSLLKHQYYQGRALTAPYHGMITSGEKRPHDMSESISIGSLGLHKQHSADDAGGRSPIQPSAPKRIILSEFGKPEDFSNIPLSQPQSVVPNLRSQQIHRFSPTWQADLMRAYPVNRVSNVDNPNRSFYHHRAFAERHFINAPPNPAQPAPINADDYDPQYPHERPRMIAPSRPPPHSTRRPVYFNFPKLEQSPTGSGELEPGGGILEMESTRPIFRSTVEPWSTSHQPYFGGGEGGSIFTPPPLPPLPLPLNSPPPLPPPPQVVNRSLDSIPLRTRATSHQFYQQPYPPSYPHQKLYVETGRPAVFTPLNPSDLHLPHSYHLLNPHYPHYDLS